MGIAPKPRGQRLALVGVDGPPGGSFIGLGLSGEQTVESGNGEFTWIPWMVSTNLGITNVAEELNSYNKEKQEGGSSPAHSKDLANITTRTPGNEPD
jgi:hypothetical protein